LSASRVEESSRKTNRTWSSVNLLAVSNSDGIREKAAFTSAA